METFDSIQEAYVHCLEAIIKNGQKVLPRGVKTREILGVSYRILNPRNRLINIPSRNWSINYAFGELFWHLSGSKEKSFIGHYSKFWENCYSHELTIEGSCYGHKIFSSVVGDENAWTKVKNLILKDPETRRAVIPLFLRNDFKSIDKDQDVACCCTIQFIVRENKMNMICNMRSNDAFLGFSYDLFLFSMLLELMSLETGYTLGWYQHNIASLHLYEKNYDKACHVIEGVIGLPQEMPEMENIEEIPRVLEYEKKIREFTSWNSDCEIEVSTYWKDILNYLIYYKLARNSNIKDSNFYTSIIKNNPYKEFILLGTST